MRIALIDTRPKLKTYSLPLLKIGAWRKSIGDECVLFSNKVPEENGFDEAWVTTCFTFNIKNALNLAVRAGKKVKKVKIGGIAATLIPEYFENMGLEVHRGLLHEAENIAPDYSLLGEVPSYSISHTSRGCLRSCKFCMVPKLEPEFINRKNWEIDLIPGAKSILFYDNNWLAKDHDDFKDDIKKLHKLVNAKKITKIDFNQGLDCRLLTQEKAELLKGLPIDPVRFAFDNMGEDGHFQKAVKALASLGFQRFSYYALYNFLDTPQDFYYRIKQGALLSQEKKVEVEVFPMRYQPILEVDRNRNYVGKYWTPKKRAAFLSIIASHSCSGQISARGGSLMEPVEEFEYWFGKNDEEFNRLLSYPDIRKLSQRKREKLRLKRHGKAGGSIPTLPLQVS